MSSSSILQQWQNFRSQILPQEVILPLLLLTQMLKNMCLEDPLGLRKPACGVQVVTHTAVGSLLMFSPLVFFLVLVLPVLVRQMKNLSSFSEEGGTRSLNGMSLFGRYLDFKMSFFHFNSYFDVTMKINLHISYITINNY